MSFSTLRGFGIAAPLIVCAQAAHADVTAQDVWTDWKDYLSQTGYEVSATETDTGAGLAISDLRAVMEIEGDTVTLELGELNFIENGDGTVNIDLGANYRMTLAVNDTDGDDDFSGVVIYAHDGSPMVVSGDSNRMVYDYASDLVTMSLEDVVIGDSGTLSTEEFRALVTLQDVTSNTVMTKDGDNRESTQELSIASMNYDLHIEPPEEENALFKVTGAVAGLGFNGSAMLPGTVDFDQLPALVAAGLAYGGTFSFDSSNSNMQFTDGSDQMSFQGSSAGGEAEVSFGADGLSYDVTQRQSTVNLSGSDIPFPIALSLEEMGVKLMMPVMKSDEAQRFELGLALREFAVPDMLWSLVDPAGELPHDPASIVLDLSGEGKLGFDLLDDAQIEAVDDGELAPGELNALDINELLVSVAGAELTGDGGFTFDNSDLESFDGMPAPTGKLNLRLSGANALLDKLVGLGFVSEDDAMGARMMMGMFAVPGNGEDVLTSTLEVTEDGQVKANGQRLR